MSWHPHSLPEIDLCSTNPCLHGGRCSKISAGEFTCYCNGTGYKGDTCETGIIITPVISNLVLGEVRSLSLSANPISSLTVNLSSHLSLSIRPNKVKLNQTKTVATFVLQPFLSGIFDFEYDLSGDGAADFETPKKETVFVGVTDLPHVPNQYFTNISSQIGLLNKGCCYIENPPLPPCPNPDFEIVLVSTCGWNMNNSAGIIFASSNSVAFPFSIAGVKFNEQGPAPNLITAFAYCTACDSTNGESCYTYALTTSDVQDLVSVQSLAFTYFHNSRPLLPPWLQLHVNTSVVSSDSDSAHPSYEYFTSIVSSADVAKLEGCDNIQLSEVGVYSVLQYSRAFEVSIAGEELSYAPDSQGTINCFAVNLCSPSSSPFFLGLSPQAQQQLLFLPSAKTYLERGWDFTIQSAVLFNSTQAISPINRTRYWNGMNFFEPNATSYDLQTKLELKSIFNEGSFVVNIIFSGTAYYLYGNTKV